MEHPGFIQPNAQHMTQRHYIAGCSWGHIYLFFSLYFFSSIKVSHNKGLCSRYLIYLTIHPWWCPLMSHLMNPIPGIVTSLGHNWPNMWRGRGHIIKNVTVGTTAMMGGWGIASTLWTKLNNFPYRPHAKRTLWHQIEQETEHLVFNFKFCSSHHC